MNREEIVHPMDSADYHKIGLISFPFIFFILIGSSAFNLQPQCCNNKHVQCDMGSSSDKPILHKELINHFLVSALITFSSIQWSILLPVEESKSMLSQMRRYRSSSLDL